MDISADTRCVTDGCWMFGAWNVASLEFCRRAYVNGQYAWPASQGSRHRSFQSLEVFEDSCAYWILLAYCCAFLILTVSFPPFGHLHLNSARSERPSERRRTQDATVTTPKATTGAQGPRGLVELDHPRLPRRSQRYNAELRQIMTFSDAFKTLPLNAPL